ncbi:UvrD-helicase domain-containing protein [Paractinoplanes rishiriensis]|nr:ATP-dependent helicase [Actinoplanes rishiriensis]
MVSPAEWRPVGLEDLEPAAWEALKYDGNSCVVAGPGSGKSEFLAQRAAYLLQTHICPPPYRILAISYKREAAQNLQDRIVRTCSPEQSRRFASVTFDAFTVGLARRFRKALPAAWQLTPNFRVVFPDQGTIRESLRNSRLDAPGDWKAEVGGILYKTFEIYEGGSWRLPPESDQVNSGTHFALARWWLSLLAADPISTPNFILLNRLAELIQRVNPQVARALAATYKYVFVDECQDTTFAQYDFLESLFNNSGTIVTSVGDDKQRIMSFGGARPDFFAVFQADFGARRFVLRCNYRSSPSLVKLQHVLARQIDEDVPEVESRTDGLLPSSAAQMWYSVSAESELRALSSAIAKDMNLRRLVPRDYAILTRNRPDSYERQVEAAMAHEGLTVRNESRDVGGIALQDLMAQSLTRAVVPFLKLAARERDPESWISACKIVQDLRGSDYEDDPTLQRALRELNVFISGLRRDACRLSVGRENARLLAEKIIEFFDLEQTALAFPDYRDSEFLVLVKDALLFHLADSAEGATSWDAVIENFLGAGSVPLMTIHKSKGLEFDTIVLIGLDDQGWWQYSRGNVEELSTFFVAVSRAKQRVVFLYCRERGKRSKVAELYELLESAGVPWRDRR